LEARKNNKNIGFAFGLYSEVVAVEMNSDICCVFVVGHGEST
jgi:hypothetical protein